MCIQQERLAEVKHYKANVKSTVNKLKLLKAERVKET